MADETLTFTVDTGSGEGDVVIRLRPDLAPGHVARITELANEGFYDGVVFHRVIDGFMAQGGDPTGTGGGGSPLGSASTCSMPLSTWPHTVYCLSRKRASSRQMKNWLLALSGNWLRAIEHTPRVCGAALNSALRSGLS